LDWEDCDGATFYDVYFGTSSPPSYVTTVYTSDYDPGPMANNMQYYWRIGAGNNCGTTFGPEWDFTTAYYNSAGSHMVVPEAIWAPASGGGIWETEVQITDLSGGSQISVYYTPYGASRRGPFLLWDNSGGTKDTSIKYDNLLQNIEGLDSGFTYYGTVGSVEFVSQDGSHLCHVMSRTSNGNYSKSSQAINVGSANTADPTRPMMIQNYASNSTYRSATGIFNPTGESLTVDFYLADNDANILGALFTKTFAGTSFQAFNPFAEAGIAYPANSYDIAGLLIVPTSGTGAVICFGATSNNITNDPASHTATQVSPGYSNSPSDYQVLPEVIWAPASGGGTWMTQVQISDVVGGSQVSVYFAPYGAARRGPFLLWDNSAGAAGSSTDHDNLLDSLQTLDPGFTYFGTIGTIEFVSQDSIHVIQATGRTFNGNYTKTFQAVQNNDTSTADTTRQMMIQNLESNATYRSAVGCFNPTANSVTVEFALISGSGSQIGSTITHTISGKQFISFNPFVSAGIPYPTYSYDNVWIKITPVSGTGKVICFGATSNNTTNDPAAHTAIQYQ
jgi:hypothetical protein